MKMIIQKTACLEIDTDIEKARINKAFKSKKDEENREHLLKLMDLIEEQKWEEAVKELKEEWWDGRDEKRECPRLEFIGCVHHDSPFFDRWISYTDLVLTMVNFPNNYKVVK